MVISLGREVLVPGRVEANVVDLGLPRRCILSMSWGLMSALVSADSRLRISSIDSPSSSLIPETSRQLRLLYWLAMSSRLSSSSSRFSSWLTLLCKEAFSFCSVSTWPWTLSRTLVNMVDTISPSPVSKVSRSTSAIFCNWESPRLMWTFSEGTDPVESVDMVRVFF